MGPQETVTPLPSPSASLVPTAEPTPSPSVASPDPTPSPVADAGDGLDWAKLAADARGVKPKLTVLPKKWTGAQVVDYMEKVVNPALGVQCAFCHPKGDFLADSEHRTRAAEMITMQTELVKEFFHGDAEDLGCITCHRGKPEPIKIPQ